MKIRFWGTRGSLPISLTAPDIRAKLIAALSGAVGRNLDTPEKIARYVDNELGFDVRGTFGGHSSCVELITGTENVIFDMGSGARALGQSFLQRFGNKPQTYHVFMSHVHWDHIMGFPFFAPVYIPGNRIVIYGCHAGMEEAFRRQHAAPCFPVDFSQLSAQIQFVRLEPGKRARHAGLDITPKLQLHSGDSYGYRFEHGGRSIVYSTDSEHKTDDAGATRDVVEFFRNADLVIFDAMYSLADTVSVKEDWGHSSNVVGVELCQIARVKHLCLYHHEPVHDDLKIASVQQETLRLEEITRGDHTLRISSAYDGLEITV